MDTLANRMMGSGLVDKARPGQGSFVSKEWVGYPGVRLKQTVFKTPFFGVPFDFKVLLNRRLRRSGEAGPLSYALIANDLKAMTGINLRYH
jgi:hypothetical protein